MLFVDALGCLVWFQCDRAIVLWYLLQQFLQIDQDRPPELSLWRWAMLHSFNFESPKNEALCERLATGMEV